MSVSAVTMALCYGPFPDYFCALLPHCLLFCGSGCLMLNVDQITKALFWSRSIARRAWNDKRSMDGKCFHRAWLFDSGPLLCLWAKFTLLDGVPRSSLGTNNPIVLTDIFIYCLSLKEVTGVLTNVVRCVENYPFDLLFLSHVSLGQR